MPTYGVSNEYSPLRRVLVRRPGSEFENPEEYKKWGYPGKPDLARAQDEHDRFVSILQREGVAVEYLEEVHPGKREPLFVHDSSIMTPAGAIMCRSGNPLRQGEEVYVAKKLASMEIPILFSVHGSATVDGGDTLWLDSDTFLVGHSYRTNHEAFRQISAVLEGFVTEKVIQISMPHYKGRGHVLHLMSVISPVDKDLAVVYPPLMPLSLVELLEARNIRMISVPEEEFDTLGSNVLAIAPRVVVIHSGNPVTKSMLEEHGCKVYEYEGEQISLIPSGGPTCLTRPLHRLA